MALASSYFWPSSPASFQSFSPSEFFLGLGYVDLVGVESGFGEDGDALGEDFDESPGHEELLVAGGAAVEADLACAEFGEQRGGAVEGLEVAGHGGQFDGLGGGVQEDAVRSDEADGEEAGLWCFCHLEPQGLKPPSCFILLRHG